MKTRHASTLLAILVLTTPWLAPSVMAQSNAVSNLGQTVLSTLAVGKQTSGGYDFSLAASFTTGSAATELTGISLTVSSGGASATGLTVALYSDLTDLGPTGLVATLSGNSAPRTAGIYTYVPTSPTTLSAASTYWVVISAPSSPADQKFYFRSTASLAEEAGGLSGWSIGDFRYLSNNGGSIWKTATSGVPMFSVGVASVVTTPRLLNLSILTSVAAGDAAVLTNFTIEGDAAKSVLVRGVGPSLTGLGVSGALADPVLTVYDGTGTVVATNDDWGLAANATAIATTASSVGAFALTGGSKDAAVLLTLSPGTYTAAVAGKSATSGLALVEMYDVPDPQRLVYVAMRKQLGSGVTTGFVLGGAGTTGTSTVLIRALGPALGLAGALANPTLNVFRGTTLIASNDNWGSAAANPTLVDAAAIAGLKPLADGSNDAAVLLTIPAGSYTVQISGVGGATGLVACEIAQIDANRAAAFAPALVAPILGQTVNAGANVTFSAQAIAKPQTVSYQWRHNGTTITGATTPTLTLTNVQVAGAGDYTVALTNTAGTRISAVVPLIVNGVAPSISVQPQPPSVAVGQNATFSVGATGSGTLLYQWCKNGVGIPGATQASLTLANVQHADAGTYSVVVSNGTPPDAVSVAAALRLTGSAQVLARLPFSGDYRDRSDYGQVIDVVNTPLAGNASLSLNGIYEYSSTGGGFRAVLPVPQLDYRGFTVAVDVQFSEFRPWMAILVGGTSARWFSFRLPATTTGSGLDLTLNNGALVFPFPGVVFTTGQWYRLVAAVDVATSTIRVFVNGTKVGTIGLPAGFAFEVEGTIWEQSDKSFTFTDYSRGSAFYGLADNLTVLNRPVTDQEAAGSTWADTLRIDTPPASQTVDAGANVSFTVAVTSTQAPTYQWAFNSVAIPGATGSSLNVTNVTPAQAGFYSVTVSDGAQSVVSTPAALTVRATGSTGAQYVAVGEGGAIWTSPEAAGWTSRASGTTLRLRSVAAAANLLVVVGETGTILTSADGVTWTPRVSGTSETLRGVAFGPNRFVAVGGYATSIIRTSNDGITWAGATVPSTTRLRAVAWGNSQFVAVGAAGTVLTSPDGATWMLRVCGASERLDGVVWTGSQFQVIGETGKIYSSADGLAWTSVQANPAGWVESLTWSSNRYVVVGASGQIAQSPSGAFWSAGNLGGSRTLHGVTWSGPKMAPSANPLALIDNLRQAPAFPVQPQNQFMVSGQTATFGVPVAGVGPFSFEWRKNGTAIVGATNALLVVSNVQVSDAGYYRLFVTNSYGNALSANATLEVAPPGLANGSVRNVFDATAPVLTSAFTIEGPSAKQMLIRAIGPTLAGLGVVGAMADPQLEVVHATSGTLVASNDDWGLATNAAQIPAVTANVGAFALAAGSKDAVVVASFSPGTYRVRASGVGNSAGVALLEIFDADTTPRLVYLATRARVGTGDGILIQGFVISNLSAGRSYLLRALGPALGSPGALADPQLVLINSGGTQIAGNDNWGGDPALASLATAAGAMPLESASSRDAALQFTPSAAGVFTAMVSGVGGTTGLAMLEIFEVDAQRAATLPAAIVSSPENVTVNAGQPVVLGVVAVGQPAPMYQWRKNGVALLGATGASYSIASVQAGTAGSYDVVVTNSTGFATSAAATVVVNGASDSATQAVVGAGYVAGGTVTVTNTLTYSGTASSLAWELTLPPGWTFASDAGSVAQVRPTAGATGHLGWAWTEIPVSPLTFTYTLNVPAGETATRTLAANAIVRAAGVLVLLATPDPLSVANTVGAHTADLDRNFRISLVELTRVIEIYNTRNGMMRTGCYNLQAGTEDGFGLDPTRFHPQVVTLARYHSADSDRNGSINLLELTRVIEFYNYRSGSTRTGAYHVQAGTEDDFAAGP